MEKKTEVYLFFRFFLPLPFMMLKENVYLI
jgi:hypothetical protein